MTAPLLFEAGAVRLRECRHGPMLYLKNDFIGRALDLYGEYSEAEIAPLAQMLAPGAAVVDVGANIGTHTIAFAKRVGPAGRVVSFEPQPPIFHLLCGNLAMNGLRQVRPVNAAVGAAPGQITVPRIDYGAEGAFNFGAVALGGWPEGEAVPVVRLDDLDLDACHLLKIDVEGMERDVLTGGARMIAAHRPVLYVENNDQAHSPALLDVMLDLGYRLYWHIAPYHSRDNFLGQEEGVAQSPVAINVLGLAGEDDVTGLRRIENPQEWWR